jgi:hypothetical protein
VVDTVFVVARHVDHSFRDRHDVLREAVDGEYWAVTLGPWYAEGDSEMSFRLYLGATPNDPVQGMFSFVPCVPVEGDLDARFARPEIRLPEVITPHLRQGKKITRLQRSKEAFSLWTEVRAQVERTDLGLATTLITPASFPQASEEQTGQ